MTTLQNIGAFLCFVAALGPCSAAAHQAATIKCEQAAPPDGMHYVCDNPQKPCYCRLEPDETKSQPLNHKTEVPPVRMVWVDTRYKKYHCTSKKAARVGKHTLRLTEEEAKRRGYKPAHKAECHESTAPKTIP